MVSPTSSANAPAAQGRRSLHRATSATPLEGRASGHGRTRCDSADQLPLGLWGGLGYGRRCCCRCGVR